ncbi:pectate lyase [Brevundimonas sp. AJA228-03]|uniref:pectate lyase n=1 Tax=Brevundimonas sp. AJA228-03 TaxID=2752515 RepID=UPI001AE0A967|nr:pectate lyase [Brevundimonas sp. AJA228-03]QTN20453.1 pectate lyase [Brevundimonas sp. AJA228-03]
MIARRWMPAVIALTATLASPVLAQTADWNDQITRRDPDWYATAEARAIADSVVAHQSPEGGWPKNTSLAVPPDVTPVDERSKNTFDNDGTTLPMAFLARVIAAGERPADRAAFDRGLDYTLAAQSPSGGWPQFYPLRPGYYTHITYNDDAMVRIMVLLREIADGSGPYGFVDADRRARAGAAVARGIQTILATQVRQNGVLTVWCAQHDETTLEPAWARAFEPPSLSGSESVGITRFLMSIPDPSPTVIAAVEGAVGWFRASAIHGMRLQTVTAPDDEPDLQVVADPQAPPLWARFYDLETNRPIFLGRDSVVHYELSQIERERRMGYRYYGDRPAGLLRDDYPAWRRRVGLS